MKTTAIVNAHLFTPFWEIKNAVIIIKNDKIARVGEKSTVTIPKNCEKINAENDIVAPGFIDIHVHGGGGYDTMDATLEAFQKIAETHIRGGTTLLLPSTVTAPIEEIEEVIKATREVMRQAFFGSRILGLHLEGPY
ncbi:MAG: N-acetylglucosamine-6-phosphate deacetylase, partial [Candidatus Aenigmatarchaeota archaeon]